MSLHVQLHFLFVKYPSQKRKVRYCVVQHMCLLSDKKCHPHSICCLPHQCLKLDHTSSQNHRSKNIGIRDTVNPQIVQIVGPQKSGYSRFGITIFGLLYSRLYRIGQPKNPMQMAVTDFFGSSINLQRILMPINQRLMAKLKVSGHSSVVWYWSGDPMVPRSNPLLVRKFLLLSLLI